MYDIAEKKIKTRIKEMVPELKHLKREKKELQKELDPIVKMNQLLDADKYVKYQKLTTEIDQLEEVLKRLKSEDAVIRHETFYSMLEKEIQSEIEVFQATANTDNPLIREYSKKRLEELNKEQIKLKEFFSYIDSLKEKKDNLKIITVEMEEMDQLQKELSSNYQAVLDFPIDGSSDRALFQALGNLRKEIPQRLGKIMTLNYKVAGLQIPITSLEIEVKQYENLVVKTRKDCIDALNRYKRECQIAQNNYSKYYSFLVSLTKEYMQMETKKMSISEKNRRTAIVKKVIHNLKNADEFKRNIENSPEYIRIIEASNFTLVYLDQKVAEAYNQSKFGVNKKKDLFTKLPVISEVGRELEEIIGHVDNRVKEPHQSIRDEQSIIFQAEERLEVIQLTAQKLSEGEDNVRKLSHLLNEVKEEIQKSGQGSAEQLAKKKQLEADIELNEELNKNFRTKLEIYQKEDITKARPLRRVSHTNEKKVERGNR